MSDRASLPGIALYGHLSQPFGLGRAARGLATALAASGLRFASVDLPWPTLEAVPRPLPTPAELGMEVGLIATNPDILRRCIGCGAMPAPSAGGHARWIGYWSWESSGGLPQEWQAMAVVLDEIWAPSSFGAACIAPFLDLPVVAMPPALPTAEAEEADLSRYGLDFSSFTFLSVFDGRSNMDRKNPLGTLRAFRIAFPEPVPGVRLLLKSRGLGIDDGVILERAIAGRPDIRLLDCTMTAAEMAALVRRCHCLVSLHRAEAFGLVIAEAMAAGRPVIATGHSGNIDFMTPASAMLVGYDLIPLSQDSFPFRRGTLWAEASVAHAAALMRQAYGQPDRCRAQAELGARRVRSILSPEAIGARIADRLRLLRRTGRLRAPGPVPSSTPTRAAAREPKLLIATPVKNGAPYLDRYFGLLSTLAFDPSRLSLALLESDSTDGSWENLVARRAGLTARYRRVVLLQHDFGFRLPPGPRYRPSVQPERRSILAKARNRLLAGALADEDWVLWLDVDLAEYPPDLIERLLAVREEIVVPHCILPNGRTFDRNTFVLTIGADGSPVAGSRPRHLEDFPPEAGPVEVHGVGGTVLLVRADLHRDGLVFPAAPYRGFLETEGLAAMARDLGHRCIGLPAIRVVHPPI